MVDEKIEKEINKKVEGRQFKIDKLIIRFSADQAIVKKKDLTHLK